MAGIDAINAIKKKLIPENAPSIKNQQNNAAFLACITTDDFSKTGSIQPPVLSNGQPNSILS
ncbi:hypothetical protein J6E39_01405 [bacterium]|nr:hypothetical protein [bacterium]